MTDQFPKFSKMTADAVQAITKTGDSFEVGISGDELYAAYLKAFPAGTDPMFKKRTEHDCSCCRHFIKNAGNIIAINNDGSYETIWDEAATSAPYPYNEVATTLRDMIRRAPVAQLYRIGKNEKHFGKATSHSEGEKKGTVITWNHFYTSDLPHSIRVERPEKDRGEYRTNTEVFERGLSELKPEAIDVVVQLIETNSLYRGEENKYAVTQFQAAQKIYLEKKTDAERNAFVWGNVKGAIARFRNSAIGSLVQDLSEGKDVDRAVASFEAKVAPANYKRTSAPVTPMMIKRAMETIEKLGLEPALQRRFACIEDVSVRDVLWVDGAVKPMMKGGLEGMLMAHAAVQKTQPDESRAEDIQIEEFMKRVLPETTGMEIFFRSEHMGNLVSLTAPVDPMPRQLFKWDNDFAWSYGGNVTDSIKERVKKAGGNVTNAKLRVSLSWFNYDDLDIHVYETGRGVSNSHICFSAKTGRLGGKLDVDMNAGTGTSREAVENVSWQNLPDGIYRVCVNNYNKRETIDTGFVIEVENDGKLSHYNYPHAVRGSETVNVITIYTKGGRIDQVDVNDSKVTSKAISQEKWGLKTEQYVKINSVMYSPNFWGESQVGNRHNIFIVQGAKNDEPTRGIYNEFLNARLEEHRKVFDLIGEKTKCTPTDNQLSGLGFSSTKKDSVLIKCQQGKKQRLLNVRVGG